MPVFDEVEPKGSSHRKYACKVNTGSDSVTICFGFEDELIVGETPLQ